jgi:hypothetical protein
MTSTRDRLALAAEQELFRLGVTSPIAQGSDVAKAVTLAILDELMEIDRPALDAPGKMGHTDTIGVGEVWRAILTHIRDSHD